MAIGLIAGGESDQNESVRKLVYADREIMKLVRFSLIPLFSLLLCLALGGCKATDSGSARPKVLHYAFSPQSDLLQGGAIRRELMVKYLSDQLHMPVEMVLVDGYGPTIEAMRAEKIDMISGSSLTYLLAAQKAGAEALVARGFPDGSIGGYRSVIAVPKDSPIHSMQDLKAHAGNLVFAFAEPASTSGYLYPRVGLQNAGINPDTDFKKVVFSGSHLATVMTLKAGKVDAAGFMATMLNQLVAQHKIAPGDVRVLWTSDLIPNGPYSVRKALPEQLKKEIQAALLAIPSKDPALWANLNSLFHTQTSGTVPVAVTDASYDGLRKYASQVKDFNLSEN
jgi:phosphonate transport system substrate-binding protein